MSDSTSEKKSKEWRVESKKSLFSTLFSHKCLLAALLIAGVAAYPLLSEPGLLNTRGGGDSPFLLQRLHQLETAVLDGHFPVRWMPDANYGYGYPFYNFYAPLSIYITAVFRLIGFSYVRAIQLSQLAGFLVAAWSMFQLGKRWWGNEAAGFITAVAYTLAPFHLVNIYTRGDSLAEFWAMAFYPLVILTADNLLRGERREEREPLPTPYSPLPILQFALTYAALILSHNISALIFTPFLALFILLRSYKNRQSPIPSSPLLLRPSALHLLFALLLALALTAWFFLPALAEQPLAQLQPVTEGYFHYSNHFRGTDLTQTSFFFDYNPDGGRAFRMSLIQTITGVLALLTLLLSSLSPLLSPLRSPAPPLLTTLIATFMITPASRFLWDHLPLLPFTQFPWRFLSVQAFGIALMMGVLALLPWRQWIVSATAVLLLLTSLGNLHTDHLILTDSDITAERLAQYEWFTGNIGTTISAEYLPPTVQPRPVTSQWLISGERWQITDLAGGLETAVLTHQRTTRQTWQITTSATTSLIFPTLHWPGWQATIDDQPVPIQPAPGSGLIQLTAPPGSYTLQLHLTCTPIRLIAELISLTALILTLTLILILTLRSSAPPLPRRLASRLSPLALLLLTIIVVRAWPDRDLADNNLTWDFAQMGYLQHGRVPFANGGILESYAYGEETAVPLHPFTLSLNWQGPTSTPATLSLHTPAIHRHPNAPALASLSQTLQPGPNEFHFNLPANIPAGLVVPQLVVENGDGNSHPLLSNSQRTRGSLFLRPFRIVNPVATAAHPRLDVQPIHIQQQGQTIQAQLAWYTPQPLSQNYNISLRLVDTNGIELVQFDTQPGYGYLPSSSWPPGQWLNDWLTIPLPDGLIAANTALVLRLYDVASSQVALTRRLGEFDTQASFQANQPAFVLPEGIEPATAVFGSIIQLHGYTIDGQTPDTLTLTLYWQALADGQTDYTRFVHLINPTASGSGIPLSQNDGSPRHNSYPTSQWTADEIISDTLTLSLLDVPPGTYQLIVGFYEPIEGLPRLTAVDQTNTPLPHNAAPLPPQLTIDN